MFAEGHQSTTIEILNGGTTKDAFPIEESYVVKIKNRILLNDRIY